MQVVWHFWNEKFDKHLTLFYISVDYCTSLLLLVTWSFELKIIWYLRYDLREFNWSTIEILSLPINTSPPSSLFINHLIIYSSNLYNFWSGQFPKRASSFEVYAFLFFFFFTYKFILCHHFFNKLDFLKPKLVFQELVLKSRWVVSTSWRVSKNKGKLGI